MQPRTLIVLAALTTLPADAGVAFQRAASARNVAVLPESLIVQAAAKPAELARPAVEKKVKEIVVEQLGVNPKQVTLAAKFVEDLGADSLDCVELVMAFEEEFSLEIPDEVAEKLTTVGAVVNHVVKASAGGKVTK